MKAQKLFLGNICTMDEVKPFANAMTVVDGKVQYVGSVKNAKALCDDNTQIYDYSDKYIYPGFLEAHAHTLFAGYRAIGQANVSDIIPPNADKYRTVIGEFIKKNPDKKIYMTAGWAENGSPDINVALLDEICPNKPLVLNTSGGHSVLLNTKAMEYFGIDAEYAKKWDTGLVRLDENGQPNGYLCEGPAIAIMTSLEISVEDAKQYLLKWQDFAFENGYTGICDAGLELIHSNAAVAHAELQKEGKSKIRTYAYMMVKDNVDDPKARIEEIAKYAKENNGEYYSVIGAKVFLDGVLEAHTAWMIEDYKDQPGYHGNERFNDKEKMVELLTEASKYNLAVHAHSDGDGSTKFFLDCIEESQKISGNMDQRNAIAHLHFVMPEDIQRVADTNSVAITPPLWTPMISGVYEGECSYIGQEKNDKSYPIKSFFDAGAVTVFHTDYPISPTLNAPLSIYEAVTRCLPVGVIDKEGGPGSQRGKEETITREQALLAITKNVARMWHQENKLGSLEIGKIANMTILDTDLLQEDIEKVPYAKIVATIVDGEEVFKL